MDTWLPVKLDSIPLIETVQLYSEAMTISEEFEVSNRSTDPSSLHIPISVVKSAEGTRSSTLNPCCSESEQPLVKSTFWVMFIESPGLTVISTGDPVAF